MLTGRWIAIMLLVSGCAAQVSSQPHPERTVWVSVEVASRDAGLRAHATQETIRLLRALPDVSVVPPGVGADYRIRLVAVNPFLPGVDETIYSISVVIEDVSPAQAVAGFVRERGDLASTSCNGGPESDHSDYTPPENDSLFPHLDTTEWSRVVDHLLLIGPIGDLSNDLSAVIERFEALELESRRRRGGEIVSDN